MSISNPIFTGYNSYIDNVNYQSLIDNNNSSEDEAHTTVNDFSRSCDDKSVEDASIQDNRLLTQTLHSNNIFENDSINSENNSDNWTNDEITTEYLKILKKDQLLSISIETNRTLFHNVAHDPELIKALHQKLKSLADNNHISPDNILLCLMHECNGLSVFDEAAPYEGSLIAFAEFLHDLNLLDKEESRKNILNSINESILKFEYNHCIVFEKEYCIKNIKNLENYIKNYVGLVKITPISGLRLFISEYESDSFTIDYIQSLHSDQLLSISTIKNTTLFNDVRKNPDLIKALNDKLKSLLDDGDIIIKDIISCLTYRADELIILGEAAISEGSLEAFANLIRDLNLLNSEEDKIDMSYFFKKNIDYYHKILSEVENGNISIEQKIEIMVETAQRINKLNYLAIQLGLSLDLK